MNRKALVSRQACKGCRHYGRFTYGIMCCNYCYDTGYARPRGEVPSECSVKVRENRKKYTQRLIKNGWYPWESNCLTEEELALAVNSIVADANEPQ